jgi:hypothetical protein
MVLLAAAAARPRNKRRKWCLFRKASFLLLLLLLGLLLLRMAGHHRSDTMSALVLLHRNNDSNDPSHTAAPLLDGKRTTKKNPAPSNGSLHRPVGPTTTTAVLVSSSSSSSDSKNGGTKRRRKETPLNMMVHQGSFGLGHRLGKLSAAHHLAGRLGVPVLEVQWGRCGSGGDDGADIFATLYGGSNQLPVVIETERSSKMDEGNDDNDHHHQGKVVLVRNDVSGYYAGQAYKNAQLPLSVHHDTEGAWREKLRADRVLFEGLQRSVPVSDFQDRVQWGAHTVIGLHVRTGNGERDHFVQAGRNCSGVVDVGTIQSLLQELWTTSSLSKPPMVFVATDTASVIPVLRTALHPWPVIALEQPRVAPGRGVSYQSWKDDTEQCLSGWKAAATDMALLAESDILVATTRSTFTQILPLSLVLARPGRQFCEMSGTSMACFSGLDAWLYRRGGGTTTYGGGGPAQPHKIMVHLPDVFHPDDAVFDAARDFLASATLAMPNETIFYYGRKYDLRYRKKLPFQDDWTWNGTFPARG